MSYRVIRPFKDLRDSSSHEYAVGDIYPRDGYTPSEDFVQGLLSGYNSAGSIFIAASEPIPEVDNKVENEPVLEENDPATDTDDEEAASEKPKSKRKSKKVEE